MQGIRLPWQRLRGLLVLIVAGAFLAPEFVQADDFGLHDDQWRVAVDRDGVQCARQEVPGSAILAVRCTTFIEAPPLEVITVILDFDRYTDWHPLYDAAFVVEHVGEREWLVYTGTKGQWPVRPRDTVDRGHLVIESDGVPAYVFRELDAHPALEGTGRVRQLQNRGRVRFEAVEGGTRFTGIQLADPGGRLPAFIVNLVSGRVAHETISAIRARAESMQGDSAIRAQIEPFLAEAASDAP
jgi:hypothetical protein